MSRNKYPEETRKLILEKSTQLFLENGYENTTIQDIIDRLGGLSKGAVYHHFKSKNEILLEVMDNMYANNHLLDDWDLILKDKSKSGKDKIKAMIIRSLSDPDEQRFISMRIDYKKSPELLSDYLKRTVEYLAPQYFEVAIRQGIEDGSVRTDFPKELAQVFMLLCNIWLNPLVFQCGTEEIKNKFLFLSSLAESFGLGDIAKDVFPLLEQYSK